MREERTKATAGEKILRCAQDDTGCVTLPSLSSFGLPLQNDPLSPVWSGFRLSESDAEGGSVPCFILSRGASLCPGARRQSSAR